MKTLQDLTASLGRLSDAFAKLAAAVPPAQDFSGLVTIVDGLTAQVADLINKLTPPAAAPAPAEPPPAPPPAA